MKTLKIIGIIALILISLGASLLWYAASKYEEVLKTVVLGELNSRLKTEMKVESLEVSPFTELPFVSLNFNEVFLPASKVKDATNDTLLYLQSLSLHFNVFDLLNEDFRARKLSLNQGLINLEFDVDGLGNFEVISERKDSASSPFLLKLESFNARDIRFQYQDKPKNIVINQDIHLLKSIGKLSESELDASLSLDFRSNTTVVDETNYLKGEELSSELAIYFNFETKQFVLRPSSLQFSKTELDLAGDFKTESYEFSIQTKGIDLTELQTNVPLSSLDFLTSAKGNANCSLRLTKPEGQTDVQVDVSFQAKNLSYALDSIFSPTKFDVEGTFTNGKSQNNSTSSLNIALASGRLNKNPFSAKLVLSNFNKPSLSFETKASLDFTQLAQWTNLDSLLTRSEGQIDLALNGSGTYAKLEAISIQSILLQNIEGQLVFDGLQFDQEQMEFAGLTGSCEVNNNNLKYTLKGRLKEQEIESKGLVVGVVPWAYKLSSRIKLDAEIFVDGINVEDFASPAQHEISFVLPNWIWLDAKVRMNSFEWSNLLAANLSFELQHRPSFSRLQNLQMKLAKGDVTADAIIRKQGSVYKLSTQSKFDGIDVKDLFFSFNQFGQNTLEDRHLDGVLGGSANIEFLFDEKLDVLPSSIFGESEFNIYKGRLIKFEPLDEVADYFASNFILKRVFKAEELRKELQDIHFDTLTNTLLVRNESIYLPQMSIKSSVLDLDVDGTYNFKNEVDFHLDFYITDLMSSSNSSSEFGEIEDDGTGRKKVFLLMTGSVDDPEFSLDKERKREERKKKVQSETKVIKDLIKDEVKKGSEEALDLEEDFEVDWSPEEELETSPKNGIDTSKSGTAIPAEKQKGIKGLLNKLKQSDTTKTELEFDFEDDDL